MFIKTNEGYFYSTSEVYVIGFGIDDTGAYVDEIMCQKCINVVTGEAKLLYINDGTAIVYGNVDDGYYCGRYPRKPNKKNRRQDRINDMTGFWFKSGPYKGKNRRLSRRMWPSPEILKASEEF